MMYSDEALAQLKEICKSCEMDCRTSECTTKKVAIIVDPDGLNLTAWFDVNKQLFGFDMLHGGCKTYDNPEEFSQFLKLYGYVNSEFLPIAKKVADKFEGVVGVNSVYDTFKGNSNSGYKALFKILNETKERILVYKKEASYIAQYIRYMDDSHFEVLKTYKYDYNMDSDELSMIPTYDSFEEGVVEYYNSLPDGKMRKVDNTYEFKFPNRECLAFIHTAEDKFMFKMGDITAKFTVSISYMNVYTKIVQINGVDCDIDSEVDVNLLDDDFTICMSLDDLYLECTDFWREYQEAEEDIGDVSDDTEDDKVTDSEESVADNTGEEQEISENNGVDDTAEAEEDTNMDEKPVDTSEVMEADSNFTIKVRKSEHGIVMYVQFVVNDDVIYNIDCAKACEIGIPVSRISDTVKVIQKKGISLTEDEKRLRKFALDISNNEELCNQMMNLLFE